MINSLNTRFSYYRRKRTRWKKKIYITSNRIKLQETYIKLKETPHYIGYRSCDLRQRFPERVHSSTKFRRAESIWALDGERGGGGGPSPQRRGSSSGSFRGRKRIVLEKRPGAARNPAPCVYDPTGATSLKTRGYAQRFHRSAAALIFTATELFSLGGSHYVVV